MIGLGYEQQVIRYTGNGAALRLIPTTFPLDSGVVAIWISGWGGNNDDCFRHSGMSATDEMGSSSPTTYGIMGFLSNGFLVSYGTSASFAIANASGFHYTAVVMRDTTMDNRYLRVGTYTGLGNFSLGMTVIGPPGGFQSAVTGVFLPDEDGMTCTDGSGSYRFTYVDATHGILTPGYKGGPFIPPAPGSYGGNFSFVGGSRIVTTAGRRTPLTHVWIWRGGFVPYRSIDFPTVSDNSMILARLSFPPYANTNLIKSLGKASFGIGTDQEVNSNGSTYHYMALSVDEIFTRANLFKSFTGIGTGSTVTVTGLGFTPAIAYAIHYSTGADGCRFKSDQGGLFSDYCNSFGGGAGTQSVRALGAGTVDIGTDVAPAGQTFYGWAFAASGSVTATPPKGWQLQRFDARLRREQSS